LSPIYPISISFKTLFVTLIGTFQFFHGLLQENQAKQIFENGLDRNAFVLVRASFSLR
jgi:hypothetical protein